MTVRVKGKYLQRKSGRRPSVADVARLAGVSPQTVSRVANGSDQVRPATRNKVLDAMEALGYAPNIAARALRVGKFGSLGLVTQDLSRTGEAYILDAIVHAGRSEGLSINLLDIESSAGHSVEQAVYQLSNQSVDGVIIIRTKTDTAGSLQLPRTLPVVVSDNTLIGQYPSVTTDEAQGVKAAVEHLLELGHETVFHLAGPEDSTPADIRMQSWREALAAGGREIPDVRRGDWTFQAGVDAASWVVEDPRITAVFAANDEMAIGLLKGLSDRGVSVPESVSVVGFDDIPVSQYLSAPLTTVRQDFDALGEALVDSITEVIDTGNVHGPRHRSIPVELVVRDTTGPVRK